MPLPSNLQNSTAPGIDIITNEIMALLNDADQGLYRSSERLIAAALLGHEFLYNKAYMAMRTAMDTVISMEKVMRQQSTTLDIPVPDWAKNKENGYLVPGFLAWMHGRMLSAANSMNKSNHAQAARAALQDALKEAPKNVFTAWALGYAAGDPGYSDGYETILQKAKNAAGTDLWAWVMITQAAANANDKNTFNEATQQLAKIVKVSDHALNPLNVIKFASQLLKEITISDYPAWAIGIISRAAITLNDKQMYDALQQPLQDAIAATPTGTAANVLGKVHNELAHVIASANHFGHQTSLTRSC